MRCERQCTGEMSAGKPRSNGAEASRLRNREMTAWGYIPIAKESLSSSHLEIPLQTHLHSDILPTRI